MSILFPIIAIISIFFVLFFLSFSSKKESEKRTKENTDVKKQEQQDEDSFKKDPLKPVTAEQRTQAFKKSIDYINMLKAENRRENIKKANGGGAGEIDITTNGLEYYDTEENGKEVAKGIKE
ncbi:hypothetical protein ACQ1Q5_00365 [Ornithobacterium rhinotracheale]